MSIRSLFRQYLNTVLTPFGASLMSLNERHRLDGISQLLSAQLPALSLLRKLPSSKSESLLPLIFQSQSQLAQDFFVLSEIDDLSRPGFFVEFGATDGKLLSNTWLLEKVFGWQGILAEPARVWRDELFANRSCSIDTRCVYSESGSSVQFVECLKPELSTTSVDTDLDDWARAERLSSANYYDVPTVSLNDLLDDYSAPSVVDYLSIDTEGSELKVLQAFDFSKRKIRVITVEHNFRPVQRSEIRKLLTDQGYRNKYPDLSQCDDWYVLEA